jgi:hypothetical protein
MDASCLCWTGIGMIVGTEYSATLSPYWENAKEKFKVFWNESVSEHVGGYTFKTLDANGIGSEGKN